MTGPEIITIVILVLNALALLLVAYQIHQNRQSILLAEKAFDDDRKMRQAELLPSLHFVIHVQVHLKRWLTDIAEIREELEHSLTGKDIEGARQVAAKAHDSPKGLVQAFLYKNAPGWLGALWMAAAQHYYEFHSTLHALQEVSSEDTDWNFIGDIIGAGKRSSENIQSLLEYIDWIVPDSVAYAPASLSDEDFLSD